MFFFAKKADWELRMGNGLLRIGNWGLVTGKHREALVSLCLVPLSLFPVPRSPLSVPPLSELLAQNNGIVDGNFFLVDRNHFFGTQVS